MKKGRPPQSQIRQNIIEIIHHAGSAYGYQISKWYAELFPAATRRVIYYHLRKGVDLGEFEIDKVEREKGEFSWGSHAEKTYYKLGKKAEARGDERVKVVVTTSK
jgi:hypothetical protein